ncbi:CPBP family intramembrane metalloprotease domain-containing protein [Paenibacillus sambharensis]|uniref:CPBP family intramembrane metalloprotease domain-containing protein n=2 Tax=Paenibacillus sambharensis TaxID=1803190 RepID=A0A2W1LB24_9BACL|nr:CPBP family intramembrane metalloprotease domain-containing protein [Paenibacillus sambharensis]
MPLRVLLGWLSFVIGLGLAVAAAQVAEAYGFQREAIQIILAVVTTGVSVPLIYLLRKYADRKPWSGLGLSSPPQGLAYLLKGAGLLLLSTGITLLTGLVFGWIKVVGVQIPAETLLAMMINLLIAFFYEAFPEELAFRGYIFQNLNTKLPSWLALITQVLLFILAPLAIIAGLVAAGIGSWDAVTWEYVLTLAVFGTALQLSRILSGNLWMCIGYHLAWLEMVRYIVVPDSGAIIEVEYLSRNGYYLIHIGTIVLSIIILLVWSRRGKLRPLNWMSKAADD